MLRRVSFLLWLVAARLCLPLRPVLAQNPCDAPNILWNCNFDQFSGSPPRQTPAGWTPFILQGDLIFMEDVDTVFGAPSLRMWSDGGTFKAGIYTQVGSVQPGVAYKASLGWAAPNAPDAFGRQLGIDPTGSTDPTAPTVVWGPMHRGAGRIVNYLPGQGPNIDVSAVAQAETVTLFIFVDHDYSTGDNYIFLDAISMFVDPVQPTVTPAPPTATTVPPTPTPPPLTSTSTSTSAPTPTPTITPTWTPTATATHTTTPTATLTPTATPKATPTPSTTLTPIRLPSPRAMLAQTSKPDQTASAALPVPPQTLLTVGLAVLGGAALLGGAAAWFWQRDRRRPPDFSP